MTTYPKGIWIISTLALVVLLLNAGCNTKPQANPSWGDTLVVYNWSAYMDPAILTQFEKQFGVKIQYHTYHNSEEMIAKIASLVGQVDIVVPTDYMVDFMRGHDFFTAINKDNIPNFANLTPELLNKNYDPGNQYCVPYFWGTTGIVYDISRTGREITSWDDFFTPEFQGRAVLLDDARMSLGSILIYLGFSPNTTNPVEIAQAHQFLIRQGSNISYSPHPEQLIADGKADIGFSWSGDVLQVNQNNPDIRYLIPKEGGIIWVDNMCVLKNAPHKRLAEEFINFILAPKVGAQLANYIHYTSPNQAAVPFIKANEVNNPILYPTSETFSRLKYIQNLDDATIGLYNSVWTDITRTR